MDAGELRSRRICLTDARLRTCLWFVASAGHERAHHDQPVVARRGLIFILDARGRRLGAAAASASLDGGGL